MNFNRNQKHKFYTNWFVAFTLLFAMVHALLTFFIFIFLFLSFAFWCNRFLPKPLSDFYPLVEVTALTLGSCFTLYFFPLGHNLMVLPWLRKMSSGGVDSDDEFFVEVKRSPAIVKGWRNWFDPYADDIGTLFFADGKVFFQGDLLQFELEYSNLTAVGEEWLGWRYLWLGGKCSFITFLSGVDAYHLRLSDREALTLPELWRSNRLIHQFIEDKSTLESFKSAITVNKPVARKRRGSVTGSKF